MGMAAILINGPWPFVQILNPHSAEGSKWSLKKISPRISEKKLFKGVDGRQTKDGWQQMASDHNSSSWAFR